MIADLTLAWIQKIPQLLNLLIVTCDLYKQLAFISLHCSMYVGLYEREAFISESFC